MKGTVYLVYEYDYVDDVELTKGIYETMEKAETAKAEFERADKNGQYGIQVWTVQ